MGICRALRSNAREPWAKAHSGAISASGRREDQLITTLTVPAAAEDPAHDPRRGALQGLGAEGMADEAGQSGACFAVDIDRPPHRGLDGSRDAPVIADAGKSRHAPDSPHSFSDWSI